MTEHLPNILTVFRILLIPVFIRVIIIPDFTCRTIGVLLFMLATFTDYIDGRLARKWNATSKFGKIMDPIADKLLVISSLFALLYLGEQIELWMVLVIIGRDILITTMRWLAIRKGTTIKVSQLGKLKTSFQMMSIFIILIIIAIRTHPESEIIRSLFQEARSRGIPKWQISIQSFSSVDASNWLVGLPYMLMFLTTVFTIFSGLRYIFTNYQLFFRNSKNLNK